MEKIKSANNKNGITLLSCMFLISHEIKIQRKKNPKEQFIETHSLIPKYVLSITYMPHTSLRYGYNKDDQKKAPTIREFTCYADIKIKLIHIQTCVVSPTHTCTAQVFLPTQKMHHYTFG